MVSAVLLVVMALATLTVLDRATSASSTNRARDVAASLAQADQDAIRQLPITDLAAGYHPAPTTKNVGGVDYTVTSTADWAQDAGGVVTCSTSGRVEYLRIKSTVTWPGMGSTKPVVAQSLVAPGVEALGANKGALTVQLTKADGTGTAGIPVTAGGVSATTDETGCAVIGNLDVGNQTLAYNVGGYVDQDGKTLVSKPVTIGAGTIAQATGYYDRAGKIEATLVDDQTPAQHANWLPRVFFNHSLRSTPTSFTLAPNGSSTPDVSAIVFPFSSAYTVYAGSCKGNDPTTYLSSYTGSSVTVAPGATVPVSLPMQRMTVTVKNASGSAQSGANIFVAPEIADTNMAGCTDKMLTRDAFPTNSAGQTTITVPFGVWRICADRNFGSTRSPSWAQVKTGTTNSIISSPPGTTGTYQSRLTTTLQLPTGGSSSTAPNSC